MALQVSYRTFTNVDELNNYTEQLIKRLIGECGCRKINSIEIPKMVDEKLKEVDTNENNDDCDKDKEPRKKKSKEDKTDVVINTLKQSLIPLQTLETLSNMENESVQMLTYANENGKTDDMLLTTLEKLNRLTQQYEGRALLVHYNRGMIAYIIKQRHRKSYYSILKITSKSQVNKLIKFYHFSTRYPNILNYRVSLTFVCENMAIIESYFAEGISVSSL